MPDSFAILWTVTNQAPLSTGFPWHEYWSALPFPCPGDLHHSGNRTQVTCIGRWVLYCWTSSVTLICNGVNFIPATFNVCAGATCFHILLSRTCRKSTEDWRERGTDQRAIGRQNANWLISLVKVCNTPVCGASVCQLCQDGIQPGKGLQKIWGFDVVTKISESEKGNCSWQTHLSYLVWPLKYVHIPLFHVLTCSFMFLHFLIYSTLHYTSP